MKHAWLLAILLFCTYTCTAQHVVKLSWTAPTADVNGNPLTGSEALTGYNVYRSTSQAGPFTKLNTSAITTPSYTDSTVVNGVTYWYTITALDPTESAQTGPAGPAVIPNTNVAPNNPTTIIIQVQ